MSSRFGLAIAKVRKKFSYVRFKMFFCHFLRKNLFYIFHIWTWEANFNYFINLAASIHYSFPQQQTQSDRRFLHQFMPSKFVRKINQKFNFRCFVECSESWTSESRFAKRYFFAIKLFVYAAIKSYLFILSCSTTFIFEENPAFHEIDDLKIG